VLWGGVFFSCQPPHVPGFGPGGPLPRGGGGAPETETGATCCWTVHAVSCVLCTVVVTSLAAVLQCDIDQAARYIHDQSAQ
jgi:hypothetical protein